MTVDDGVAPLYEFVYRGLLTEEALDAAGRTSRYTAPMELSEITHALSLELFEEEFIGPAQLMSIVYTAIAAFKNSVRRFVYKVLIDKHGENGGNWEYRPKSEVLQRVGAQRRKSSSGMGLAAKIS